MHSETVELIVSHRYLKDHPYIFTFRLLFFSCFSGFCDFEKDMCTWKNLEKDQFDWIRGTGNTESIDTGPTSDHTLGTPKGHYIYIETSLPQTPGDVARLQSEDFLPSNISLCLRFWYQMNGEDVDSLSVLVQNVNEKGKGYVWSQKGDNGPHWLYAQLNVDQIYTSKPYHVSLSTSFCCFNLDA